MSEEKITSMNGFVKSRRPVGVYCMKRHINPGQKVDLNVLYEQYGVVHDIPSGPEFVRWLRTVKLKRRDIWEIMYDNMPIVSGEEPFEKLKNIEKEQQNVKAEEVKKEEPKIEEASDRSGKISLEGEIEVSDSNESSFSFPSEKKTGVGSTGVKAIRSRVLDSDKPVFTTADILEFKLKDLDKIDKVEDIRILKIALNAAEDMRNKATLCKRLKSRIGVLKPRSRFGSV